MPAPATTARRRPQQRGLDTRRDVLEAALVEFAAVGFDAASTRAIATRAGIKQGQLTYHFETKDDLWRATVDHLFRRFDAALADALESLAVPAEAPAAVELEATVRALVKVFSRMPELNRLMVHASTTASDRLTWLVDHHVRARFEQLGQLWQRVRDDGATHLAADPLIIYYCILGAASLLYVNAPEAAHLLGATHAAEAIDDARVDAHATAIVAMLLGPHPNAPRRDARR